MQHFKTGCVYRPSSDPGQKPTDPQMTAEALAFGQRVHFQLGDLNVCVESPESLGLCALFSTDESHAGRMLQHWPQ